MKIVYFYAKCTDELNFVADIYEDGAVLYHFKFYFFLHSTLEGQDDSCLDTEGRFKHRGNVCWKFFTGVSIPNSHDATPFSFFPFPLLP